MKQLLAISFLFIWSGLSFAQPANDNCASATTLTIGGGLICGENASGATLQGSECFTNYAGGSTESTMWYRINATNDSLVLNFIITNSPNCAPHIAIYGPFAAGTGCLPACASQVYNSLQTGDPGNHELITGLTSGSDYLIQVQNNSCGGPGAGAITFCLGMDEPATNALSTGATFIDECGTMFSETTDGGYWNSGTGPAFADLDSTAGDDVGFVINNFAWNTFCSLTAGTWQITVSGVSGCNLPAPNQGIQAAVFTGTQASLTLEGSQSPIAPGGSWGSPIITVDSAECAYLGIDGFAGDVCDYQVTLTNITGGCVILSTEFLGLEIEEYADYSLLSWVAANEYANDHFIIEKSTDGSNFRTIGTVKSYGDHSDEYTYYFQDDELNNQDVYYRLSEKGQNGEIKVLAIKHLKKSSDRNSPVLQLFPNPVKDLLNIEYTQSRSEEVVKLMVYDLSGTIVSTHILDSEKGYNHFGINLNHLKSGNYFVKIISPNGTFVERFIKD